MSDRILEVCDYDFRRFPVQDRSRGQEPPLPALQGGAPPGSRSPAVGCQTLSEPFAAHAAPRGGPGAACRGSQPPGATSRTRGGQPSPRRAGGVPSPPEADPGTDAVDRVNSGRRSASQVMPGVSGDGVAPGHVQPDRRGGRRSESSRRLKPVFEAGGRVPVRVGLVSNRHPHRMVRRRF